MVKQSELLTTDLSEFLQQQYEKIFKKYYDTFGKFKDYWKNDAVMCGRCKTWRWKGNSKRCDCSYCEHFKTNNHASP